MAAIAMMLYISAIAVFFGVYAIIHDYKEEKKRKRNNYEI